MKSKAQDSQSQLIKADYQFCWGALVLAALLIGLGAIMVFLGLQGSFNWIVQSPATTGARIENASPGIVFATMGFMLALVVVLRRGSPMVAAKPQTRQSGSVRTLRRGLSRYRSSNGGARMAA